MANSFDEELLQHAQDQKRKSELENYKSIQRKGLVTQQSGAASGAGVQKTNPRKSSAARQAAIFEAMYNVAPKVPSRQFEGGSGSSGSIVLPNLIGLDPVGAASTLSNMGLRGFPQIQQMSGVSQPSVIATTPMAGSEVTQGDTVTLLIAIGEDQDNEDEEREDEDRGDEKKEKEEGEDEAKPKKEGEGSEGSAKKGLGEGAETGAEAGELGAEAGAAAGAGAGGAAAGGAAAGATVSAPVWGTALAIIGVILLIIGLVIFIFMVLVAGCNQAGLKGSAARGASTVVGWFGGANICKNLTFNGGRSGGGGAGASWALDIVLTSAYRPGAIVAGTGRPSAHGRGEAVDIALRNPTVPEYSNDPRIAQLVQMARSAGFTPAAGDTLDEYTKPTEGASGGHIHIEFNTKSDGTTYCDGTRVAFPPTDLVAIPSSIPTSGVSDSRLRPCMLTAVQGIFSAAAAAAATTPIP